MNGSMRSRFAHSLGEAHYKTSRLRYAQTRLAGPQPFCWVTLNACGSEAAVACCTMTSLRPHPFSTSEKAVRRSPPIVRLRRMAISSKLPVYWKSVCLKMKGFTPAAYTPSRFQHLPATALSSGSPRLPHPHLMMEIILLIATSRQSDPDHALVARPSEDQDQASHTRRESENRH